MNQGQWWLLQEALREKPSQVFLLPSGSCCGPFYCYDFLSVCVSVFLLLLWDSNHIGLGATLILLDLILTWLHLWRLCVPNKVIFTELGVKTSISFWGTQFNLQYFPIWLSFISFACRIVLARTSNTLFNTGDKSGHSCLFPGLSRKHLIFTIKFDDSDGVFHRCPL